MKPIFTAMKLALAGGVALTMVSGPSYATAKCGDLPSWQELKDALAASGATALEGTANDNGGLRLDMWGAIVNRDGVVCAVAFTGGDRDDQWPGSRVIAAAKAYTGNAYSLAGLAVSTANLYAVNQPGGNFWGLQFSNPTAVGASDAAYKGPASKFGTAKDPMVGTTIGGQIVFGGGFGLYNSTGKLVGGLGVSGDTSCKDHNFGWRVRDELGLDYVPNGPAAVFDDPKQLTRPDNIIYDIGPSEKGNTSSVSGFGHVDCGLGEADISTTLPEVPVVP